MGNSIIGIEEYDSYMVGYIIHEHIPLLELSGLNLDIRTIA